MNPEPQTAPESKFDPRETVYVVTANAAHLHELKQALMSFYVVRTFNDVGAALALTLQVPPTAVVLDEAILTGKPSEMLVKMGEHEATKKIPIVFTIKKGHVGLYLSDIGRDCITCLEKPYKRSDLVNAISKQVNKQVEKSWETIEPVQKQALVNTLQSFNSIADLIDDGAPVPYDKVKDSCQPLVQAISAGTYKDLLKGVRGHDNYSYVHSLRVATFLSLFGANLGIKGEELMTLSTGGLLHDVGKMQIPHEVLNKPGKLSDDEFGVMKSHVTKTSDFLALTQELPEGVIIIAEQHHEKLDGSGYPKGLKNGQLNELARMASIIDVFGALTDRRVYKDPMPPEKALDIMADMKGHLDQHFLYLFREMLLDAATPE